MSADDYVDCWFIGGPWDNQLLRVHKDYLDRHRPIEAVILVEPPVSIAGRDKPIRYSDVSHKTVTYRLSFPLKTGVAVYSCLNIY